jgi:2-amino-4-hydroxy-6-hydroxymethyldihydropteridine diphosphokinase
VYCTKPQYVLDQPDFFNLVVFGNSELEPDELLDYTQRVEASLGRNRDRERPKGERTLDIDILLFGSKIIKSDHLSIPHPGMIERAFVLVPLLELDDGLVHPETGIRISNYLPNVQTQGIYLFSNANL